MLSKSKGVSLANFCIRSNISLPFSALPINTCQFIRAWSKLLAYVNTSLVAFATPKPASKVPQPPTLPEIAPVSLFIPFLIEPNIACILLTDALAIFSALFKLLLKAVVTTAGIFILEKADLTRPAMLLASEPIPLNELLALLRIELQRLLALAFIRDQTLLTVVPVSLAWLETSLRPFFASSNPLSFNVPYISNNFICYTPSKTSSISDFSKSEITTFLTLIILFR